MSLRKLYRKNKEAREFLKKHPEFNGFESESTHNKPSNGPWKDKIRPVNEERVKTWVTVLNNLDFIENELHKRILEAYLIEGAKIGKIAALLNSSKTYASSYIGNLKKIYLKRFSTQYVNFKKHKIVGNRYLTRNGQTVRLDLWNVDGTLLWCTSEGQILEDDIQEELNK